MKKMTTTICQKQFFRRGKRPKEVVQMRRINTFQDEFVRNVPHILSLAGKFLLSFGCSLVWQNRFGKSAAEQLDERRI